MSFHSTATVLDALSARLVALPRDPAVDDGEKLFELVSFYRTTDIARAFKELYFTQQRVCLIVPVGMRHNNQRDRLLLIAGRTLTFDLLLADRSFDKAAQAALTGGDKNIGVIEMAERVMDSLLDEPLALADALCEPDEGAPLLLTSDQQPNDPGRVCWVQSFHLRAGLKRSAVQ